MPNEQNSMKSVFLVFPNQLFRDVSSLMQCEEVHLIEEFLFFKQYRFHKQKLVLHRASMKAYAAYLEKNGLRIRYIDSASQESDIRSWIGQFSNTLFHYYDVCDQWLEQRIAHACKTSGNKRKEHHSLLFLNTKADLDDYFGQRETYFQTDFYIRQRKKYNILLNEDGKPQGGKWSFDADNRKKYPADKKPPRVKFPDEHETVIEAKEYVQKHYPDNPGALPASFAYPVTHEQAEAWMLDFFQARFAEFGVYEDALVASEGILNHSVLSPLLNVGLLEPMQVVKDALFYADQHAVPLNSLEGFIRQLIGWREFIRGVYLYRGIRQRTANYWDFKRPVPLSFYTADTGIEPVDCAIRKVLSTAYNHHIERLMVLGNFMLLCEFSPNAVYQWFMEMYIDAYDWVMVPNVYGMSQFADGGLMATKPYISGSNYILKMSDFRKGNWCDTWDALFWEFMNKQRAFFSSNPRLGMLLKTYDRMSTERKEDMRRLVNELRFS